MLAYIIRRILIMIPVIIMISILSFIIIELPPGDFVSQQISVLYNTFGADAEMQIETLRERYGLDQPAHIRYLRWVQGIVFRGDFGRSFVDLRPVTEIIRDRLLLTVIVSSSTLLFTWMIAIPIGVYCAVKQYTIVDYFFTLVAFIGQAIPNFLLAMFLMFFFYETFGWAPGGLFSREFQDAPWSIPRILDLMKHLVIPMIVIGTAGAASLVRVLRGMFLDELNKEYVQTARAKGLKETIVLWKHILRIAILPIVSTIGWLLPVIVSGEAITSIVMNLPTIGGRLLQALQDLDMYVAGSIILILSVMVLVGTLISDILLAWLDPRIRYE